MLNQKNKNKFTQWVVSHDDSIVFIVLYISMAVLLSIFISLFWLLFVVCVHFAFEYIKAVHHNYSRSGAIRSALWEVKLDITLLLFAVWLGVYMDFIFGIAGIGVAARAVAQGGSRFLAWQRVLRGILISLDDVVQLARFSVNKNKDKQNLNKRITIGDLITLSFLFLFAALILLAPFLINHSYADLWFIIINDLKPIP